MSEIDRNKVRKLILKEFKMMGMGNLGSGGLKVMGLKSGGCDDYGDVGEDALMPTHSVHTPAPMKHSHKGSISREACCAAVMCLIECCSCPVTKQALMECCADIMAGDYDH